MEFVALDFETANGSPDSACALGIIKVSGSKVVEEKYWLIRPPNLYFDWRNIQVHGITASDVHHEKNFEALFSEIQPYITDNFLLAHNAAFDMNVLRAVLNRYDIAVPHNTEYMCTVSLSRRINPFLPNHKLNTIANYLNFDFMHHHALHDSRVCAQIALKAFDQCATPDLYEIAKQHKIKIHRLKA